MEEQNQEPKEVGSGQNTSNGLANKFNTKTAIIIAFVLILVAVAYSMKGLFIAATVNGSPIMRLTVIKELEKDSGKDILDALISEKIILNEAEAKGIKVTDEEINSEIKILEDQIIAQGDTLENLLKTKNISLDDIKRRIILQKDLEKLVGDKVVVTDAEITAYIKDNKVTIPKGQEAALRASIKEEITKQKVSVEAENLITELRTKAKISYFVNY